VATVLIVTTHFYPDPTVAAVRVTQWARWLPAFGWRPLVLARYYGFDATSEQIAENVHPSVELRHLGRGEGRPSPRRARFVRSLAQLAGVDRLYVPDPSIRFWRSREAEFLHAIDELRPDVLLTSGPPHAIHHLGLAAKRAQPRLPWVADFRDPGSIDPRYRPGLLGRSRRRTLAYEMSVYRSADLVTTAIPVHARWIRSVVRERRSAVRLILNGAPAELASLPPERTGADGVRRIRSVGVAGDQEAITLADAVALLRRGGKNLSLRFVGPVPEVAARIRRALDDPDAFTGQLPHRAALREIVEADLLVALLSEARARTLGVSSKLFEYLAVPAPVVIVNPTRSDRRMFARLPGVFLLTAPSVSELARVIEGGLDVPRALLETRARSARERWGRQAQVAQLAQAMDRLAGIGPGRPLREPRGT
jgi:hypothetical protein